MWAGMAMMAGTAVFMLPTHTNTEKYSPLETSFELENELVGLLQMDQTAPELDEDAVKLNLNTIGDNVVHYNIIPGQ